MKKIIFLILVSTTISFAQFKELSNSNIKIDESILKQNIGGQKSKTLAFFLSLVLPGSGEYYVNRFDAGKYFVISEVGLWLTYFGFDYYGRFQKDNYITFAKINGSVEPANKDDNYWAAIGSYMNIYDYNNEKLLNRDFNNIYDEKVYYWNWNSNDERKKYRNLWLSSEKAFNNRQFPLAFIVVNHIVSAINATILAGKYNERLQESSLIIYPQLGFDEFQKPQLSISLLKNF